MRKYVIEYTVTLYGGRVVTRKGIFEVPDDMLVGMFEGVLASSLKVAKINTLTFEEVVN